jgi:aspartyl-tRNA(Asn)/glutamyl-tRNA(Gln) amidotransferase subunit A
MREARLTAVHLIESCLERIHQREETVHAWVNLYERQALEEARRLDKLFQKSGKIKTLQGIPVGVKDIIHVKGMKTTAGCAVYQSHVAETDADCVRRLRAAGAIILGKTETTPFANNDPTITRNPWNPEHTPGGSSSGSGAAVGDRMCLAALGTQTGGSLLRPAAYNGIVGLKPTYSYISLDGVIPVSWTMDHVGPHARSVADAALLCRVMKDPHPNPFGHMIRFKLSVSENWGGDRAPRLGYIQQFFEDEATADMKGHMAGVIEKFKAAGAQIVQLNFPDTISKMPNCHRAILETELATYQHETFKSLSDQYPPNIKTRIERGMIIPGQEYVNALHLRITFQKEMAERLSFVDAALMITAHSTAPKGLGSTGSSTPLIPWSFSGFPSITVPAGLDRQGLPYGVQLAATPMNEEHLVQVASWCEKVLAFSHSPA